VCVCIYIHNIGVYTNVCIITCNRISEYSGDLLVLPVRLGAAQVCVCMCI